MADLKTFHQLFIHELRDLASAEEQILRSLPRMAKAASDESLREALEAHREETEGHLELVLELLEKLGESRGTVKCAGMAGIISEGDEKLKEKNADPGVLDAAIIASAQKVEHYEIASYGTAKAWAALMGHEEAVSVLDDILSQEKAADEKLTSLSDSINIEAQDEDDEGVEEKAPAAKPRRASTRRI